LLIAQQMPRITSFELFAVDLPFKKPFKHAAAKRVCSDSIVLKCVTDSGTCGFGECLPRDYVTGEARDGAYGMLKNDVLPRLVGSEFKTLNAVFEFLDRCNGKAPVKWVPPAKPQTAAWAAVDLALLDTFGREFGRSIRLGDNRRGVPAFRYSAVFSAEKGLKAILTLLKFRLYGFAQVKLKIDKNSAESAVRRARQILGQSCDIRVDANMTWNLPEALAGMPELARFGVRSFEQPLSPDDIQGLAVLVKQTGLDVMVDESLNDHESLEKLIAASACTAVNIRISKCGGLVAAFNRAMRALDAGLAVQVGSQVGETSLLSAAQLILISALPDIRFAEGCYGHHLLKIDPALPLKQFGYGGRPPGLPNGTGLGVALDEALIRPWCRRSDTISV
jgi:muconate cycloisomerase